MDHFLTPATPIISLWHGRRVCASPRPDAPDVVTFARALRALESVATADSALVRRILYRRAVAGAWRTVWDVVDGIPEEVPSLLWAITDSARDAGASADDVLALDDLAEYVNGGAYHPVPGIDFTPTGDGPDPATDERERVLDALRAAGGPMDVGTLAERTGVRAERLTALDGVLHALAADGLAELPSDRDGTIRGAVLTEPNPFYTPPPAPGTTAAALYALAERIRQEGERAEVDPVRQRARGAWSAIRRVADLFRDGAGPARMDPADVNAFVRDLHIRPAPGD